MGIQKQRRFSLKVLEKKILSEEKKKIFKK